VTITVAISFGITRLSHLHVRAAEQLKFGIISTSVSDDIMRITDLAQRIVTEFGMSDKLGCVRYADQQIRYIGSPVFRTAP
jgi:ATP-dependent Zn protease